MIQWSRGSGKSTKELQLLCDAYDVLTKKEETKMTIDKIKNLDESCGLHIREKTIDCDTIILGIENCLKNTCWKCPYLNESRCRYVILEDALFILKHLYEKEDKKIFKDE